MKKTFAIYGAVISFLIVAIKLISILFRAFYQTTESSSIPGLLEAMVAIAIVGVTGIIAGGIGAGIGLILGCVVDRVWSHLKKKRNSNIGN